MIDYTNYKKFYSSGDEYNIAILDQETSCIKTTPLSSSLVNYNAYISELIYSPDGYVRMYVNGYYVEWEAFEQDHGVLNIAYDEYGLSLIHI